MAYQESVVSAITDIPALVATFAASAGWTVSGTTSPIMTRPGGGLSFQLTASISGSDHILQWAQSGGADATSNARVVSPKLNGPSGVAPVVSIPSKIHLFGDTEPEPFLAIVVEYGFNSYRHLYLGNMVKASAYTGGEVISGAQPLNSSGSSSYPISYRTAEYLFSGHWKGILAAANSGGVRAVHANNPTPWRRFYHSGAYPFYGNFDGSEAIGGFCDDVNDGYVARGRSSFAGVQILSPISLYAAMPITGDTLFAPLGYPAGVRHVNVADLEPGAEFVIGSQNWMAFPAFAKGATSVSKSASGWGLAETSYHVGYAYPKD